MSEWMTYTPEQKEAFDAWISLRPKPIRELVAQRGFQANKLYRHKESGLIMSPSSFEVDCCDECDQNDAPISAVTLSMRVYPDFDPNNKDTWEAEYILADVSPDLIEDYEIAVTPVDGQKAWDEHKDDEDMQPVHDKLWQHRQAISFQAFQLVHHMLSQIIGTVPFATFDVRRPVPLFGTENLPVFRQEAQAFLDMLLPPNFIGAIAYGENDCSLVLAMRKDDEVRAAIVSQIRLAEVKNTGQEPSKDNTWVQQLHDRLANFQPTA